MRSRPARSAILVALLLAGCGSVKSPTEPSGDPEGDVRLGFNLVRELEFGL